MNTTIQMALPIDHVKTNASMEKLLRALAAQIAQMVSATREQARAS